MQVQLTASKLPVPTPVAGHHRLTALTRTSCLRLRAATTPARASSGEQLPSSVASVTTDAAVPESHKGLHGFLYGEGGAEAHDDGGSAYKPVPGEDDGSILLPVAFFLASREGKKPAAVYGLYDADRVLQYVGYSRNAVLAVKNHLARVGEECCRYVRVRAVSGAMPSRAAMQAQVDAWHAAEGAPAGDAALWEGRTDAALMTEAERATYEEKKLKLTKAMGANLADEIPGETDDLKRRRLKTIAAMEGDDWSAVIDGQTRETMDAVPAEAAEDGSKASAGPGSAREPLASPFTRARVHRSIGNNGGDDSGHAVLTVESAHAALEEVRPYLMADGGNVRVVGVEDGVVHVELEGACGTCASSASTMKMGIERSLRAAFGDALKEVVQANQKDNSASVAAVDEHLNMLRPAIAGLGGSVEVVNVLDGRCELRYNGPAPIGTGIVAAVKDRFPDISDVVLLE